MSQPPQGPPPYGQPPPGGGWWQPGPYGPPSPQGAWGRQPPGPYGPPPGAGGWGPPPSGPGWTPPGGPGRPRDDRRRALVIAAVAGLALVAVVGVLLAVTLRGSAQDATTATDRSAGSTAAVDPLGLLARLPADFTDCAPDDLAGDGDLAAASCGSAASQPGPADAAFYLYPDAATLDRVFTRDIAAGGLAPWPEDADCSTSTGYGQWARDGVPGGQVACAITDDGHVVVAWTDAEFLIEGIVRGPGTTQAEVGALYRWWTANSWFQE